MGLWRDGRAFDVVGVVPHRPLVLVPSSWGTTSPSTVAVPAGRTWCLNARYPLFLRLGAPRPQDTRGRLRTGRGASQPASLCSFVLGHHVPRTQRASGNADVVLHRPQSLIPSSGGTTSSSTVAVPAGRTWCLNARYPLFLRLGAPRPQDTRGRLRTGRGASQPASLCSFVLGHHVPRTQRASGNADVVLHRPQSLIPSSGGTTSSSTVAVPAGRTWCFTAR